MSIYFLFSQLLMNSAHKYVSSNGVLWEDFQVKSRQVKSLFYMRHIFSILGFKTGKIRQYLPNKRLADKILFQKGQKGKIMTEISGYQRLTPVMLKKFLWMPSRSSP